MGRAAQALVRAWDHGAWWLHLLAPLEWLFRALAALRRLAYRSGLLKVYRPDKPVVVVGNITVGGTGKTPVVIALVEALRQRGLRAGVVSRGYGASSSVFPHTVTTSSTAADCGDEALLLYRRTQCPCVVDPSRSSAARTLLESFAVDVIISDDGLQHYALARDMEIVMVDAAGPFGNAHCLPVGPLREPTGRLAAADFVLTRGSDDPATGVRYSRDCLVNVATGEARTASTDGIGASVYAVAGIGRPAMFLTDLRALGFSVEERLFEDHHNYRSEDFKPLTDRPVIMTEKDAVKCQDLVGDNAWYLRISAHLSPAVTDAVASLAGQ